MTVLQDPFQKLSDVLNLYRHRVDYLQIRLEVSEGTDISWRDDRLETLSEFLALGGHVRACYRGGWGFASFNGIELLTHRIEEAIASAHLLGSGMTELASVPAHQSVVPLDMQGTFPRQVSLSQKKELCQHYHSLLQHEGILSSGVSYNDSYQKVWLGIADAQVGDLTLIEQSWSDLELRYFVTARQGNQVQTIRESIGSRQGFENVLNLEPQVMAAPERALKALTIPGVEGGIYPVVLDPILTGLFVHEAFGHLSEADTLSENPDLLDLMSLGRRFGSEILTIMDGAAPSGHRGSYVFDDEGVPASSTPLIQSGYLVGRLHSRESAGILKEMPTGNARCLSYLYPPMVRMTNTWIEPGQTPPEELIQSIDQGIYACGWQEGMTNGEVFTFTPAEAWIIRQGEKTDPVRDATLSGNVFETLANIVAIGNDFCWDESGGCGKGGQEGLPVGVGGPSLLIENVVIG